MGMGREEKNGKDRREMDAGVDMRTSRYLVREALQREKLVIRVERKA